jgi:amphi-Trp domain-containing protein
MKIKRKMSRYALARRLHDIALQISAGMPVRIGGRAIQIPDHVSVEEEFELNPGEVDLEFEIHWPSRIVKASSVKSARVSTKRQAARR